MNFARLNHILIPSTKEGRDKVRSRWGLKLFRPVLWLNMALSREGRALLLMTVSLSITGVNVRVTQVYLLWATFVGLLIATLAARRLFALRGVDVQIKGPPRVAVGEPMTFEIHLANRTDLPHHTLRVDRPFLPWDGKWEGEPPMLATLSAKNSEVVLTRARFVERGTHSLDPFEALALVPLGLGRGPIIHSPGFKFTVVPHIAQVTRVTLPSGRGAGARSGRELAGGTGDSRELAGVRPYRPGDAVRQLHVRTWARTGEPHVREYHEPVPVRVAIVVDAAGKLDAPAFEATTSLAAGVIACLEQEQERLSVLVGETHQSLEVGRGHAHLEAALDELAELRPSKQPEPPDPDPILRSGPTPAAVIVIGTQSERVAGWSDAFERAGVPARGLLVADKQPRELLAGQTWVPTEDIEARRSLAL